MRHRSYANKIHYSTIQEAIRGDATAIDKIMKHYEGYIMKLSTEIYYDQYGKINTYIDEDIRRQLQAKLITKISGFKLY